ncbi:MAG: GFA family protein [Gammaproteobacteria bacterium]
MPDAERFGTAFCRRCGSLVPRRSGGGGDRINIPAGSLDSDPGIGPAGHIYVGSKAPWFEITDDLPQWETTR